eukprot:TRINITY_DN19401_c0_g1_i1.p1 TRINITY_DN19401_c0_g1~~TRINITY_DN19401_c0_g1_i1.p1  ORF type:complete len:359 (+),score=77.06 TRINITY_DN19401_c0_g1_i1:25-1101(+)
MSKVQEDPAEVLLTLTNQKALTDDVMDKAISNLRGQPEAYLQNDGLMQTLVDLLESYSLTESTISDVVSIAANVLTKTLDSDKSEVMEHCLSVISNCSTAALALVDVDISSSLLTIFKTKFIKRPKKFQTLCLSAIKNVAKLNPTLVEEVQLTYHRLARGPSENGKRIAMEIAVAATSCSLDYFGYGTVFVPSFDYEEALHYYSREINRWISPEFQQLDILQLICELSTETYRLGQLIDAQDGPMGWCAAEITKVKYPKIHVHYTGWKQFDEWIELPSQRIAPAFTFTNVVPKPGKNRKELDETERKKLKEVTDCAILGLLSEDMTRNVFLQFRPNSGVQYAINYARWMNRENLKHIL